MLDLPSSSGGGGGVTGVSVQFQLIKLSGGWGKLEVPVAKGGDGDLNEVRSQGARFGNLVPVKGSSEVEDEERKEKADGGNPIAEAPPKVVLDVDKAECGKESAQE